MQREMEGLAEQRSWRRGVVGDPEICELRPARERTVKWDGGRKSRCFGHPLARDAVRLRGPLKGFTAKLYGVYGVGGQQAAVAEYATEVREERTTRGQAASEMMNFAML
jgi:hypothetical protein